MTVTKKVRTDHKCLWQRKKDQTTNVRGKRKNGCPNQASKHLTPNERKTKPQKLVANEKELPYNQASKQLTPNERNKTAETTSKTQTVAYLQT